MVGHNGFLFGINGLTPGRAIILGLFGMGFIHIYVFGVSVSPTELAMREKKSGPVYPTKIVVDENTGQFKREAYLSEKAKS
jgi:hypothetical protein